MDALIAGNNRWALLFVALWLLSSIVSPLRAQTLTADTSVNGEIRSGEQDRYDFIARDGQVLSISVRGSDGLDPVLTLRGVNDDILLQTDDYAYPSDTDARLEGFSAPYTGSYILEVSGFGTTAGAYTLEVVTGYSTTLAVTDFDAVDAWRLVDTSGETSGELSVVNGSANLTQAGIDAHATALGFAVDADTYYINARVDSISGAQGWRAGLVFNYLDEDNYYRVLVNNSGAWRLERRLNGESTLLRNWNTHPAIRPAVTPFTLGVLVNDRQFDIFYDNQYVGTERDDALQRAGQVGLALITPQALGSTVTARYDRLAVSTPDLPETGAPLDVPLVASGMNAIVRELEHRLIIPTGGEMALTLSESFAQNVPAGVSRFALGGDLKLTDGIIAATVDWLAGTEATGCGLVLRDTGADDRYLLAYVDSDGGYGLALRDGANFINSTYHNDLTLTRPYQFMIIAVGDQVHLYLNRQYATSLTVNPVNGGVGMAVINFEAASTTCDYQNVWIWRF